MVRKKQFTTRTGKDGSARYFTEHLSASDYYESRGGILKGKTFEHMGMSKREVDFKVFSALESNLHPETGERITLRSNNTRREWWINPETGQEEIRIVDNHRPGMDLPFIVPKTLSEVMA
ncbi:MAG TPA: relaxase domain-containing protein, partial [Chthoniobacterales bacterium]|nr:relaxase domain-containing protein [Chthoniobacterales bacterium]